MRMRQIDSRTPTTPLPAWPRAVLALLVALVATVPLAGAPRPEYAVAANPGVLLLGTANHGVYRSRDGGGSWQPANAGLPGGGVWQVAADPSLPGAAYATTGTLYRTADGGGTWAPLTSLQAGGPGFTTLGTQGTVLLAAGPGVLAAGGGHRRWTAERIVPPAGAPRLIVPAGPDLLYIVGGDGRVYLLGSVPAWTGAGGWRRLAIPASGEVTALAYMPGSEIGDTGCPRDECVALYAAVSGHGIWTSNDSGRTWAQESSEHFALPRSCTVRVLLASRTEPGTVYAAVDGLGLYRSQDNSGQFWKPAAHAPALDPRITALVQQGRTLLAATAGQGVQIYAADRRTFIWRGSSTGLPSGAIGLSLAALAPPPLVVVQPLRLPGPACRRLSREWQYPVCGVFLRFYQRYTPSNLLFGNPLTGLLRDPGGSGRIVQYFERARFEYTPSVRGGVTLAPLGRLLTVGRRFPHTPVPPPRRAFSTGYSVGAPFLAFWLTHHGQEVLGDPISAEVTATNGDGSGRVYRMQYFVNGRLEFHPEQHGTHFAIELGLLGRAYLACGAGRSHCEG